MANKKVLFLLPYPLRRAPSQRFRVEAFFHLLQQHNICYATHEFLDEDGWQVLYQSGSFFKKAFAVCKGFARRLKVVLGASDYAYIFIHREAAPLGPPFFEWLLAKVLKKKIIYDFDDAIWIPNTSMENKLAAWLKSFWKIKHICRWAYKVVGGNEYLCTYARRFNHNVVLLPTCVDTSHRFNKIKNQHTDKIVIGWTGSHSTMPYLKEISEPLKKICSELKIQLLIISNKKPEIDLPYLQFIKWKEAGEIEDLLNINIGLMPLKNDEWSEGKCGFKLIQYMALGIPAVASPVGVNVNIVSQGINGYLCETEDEWYAALKNLILNYSLRNTMGIRGREKIVAQFSIQANADSFLGLFN